MAKSKKKPAQSTNVNEPRLDLATVYAFIEASGKNGCKVEVERELRFHGSEMADGKSIFEIKRKCTPEDILSIVCCIGSIMALIFGLVNPKSPEKAFASVKEAKNAVERGDLDVNDDQTQGAAGPRLAGAG